MMNESSLLSKKRKTKANTPIPSSKDELNVNLPPENNQPLKPKEFPVNKWNMPPEQQGYIKINDNDFL